MLPKQRLIRSTEQIWIMKKKPLHRKTYWIPIFSILVLLIFVVIMVDPLKLIGKRPANHVIYQTNEIGAIITVQPTLTPLPTNYPKLAREYFDNENQTDGIIIGGTALVLIILIGSLVHVGNEHRKKNTQ